MSISNAQIIGLALVAGLIGAAFFFLWYISPKVSAIFRPSLRTAIYWLVGILLIQTGFILAGG